MNCKQVSLIAFLVLGTFGIAEAQEQQAQQAEGQEISETLRRRNEADQRVYQLALRYNDVSAARVKLLELIERNPNNTRYAELLVSLYFENNQFGAAAVSALDLLERDDRNLVALEVAAYSLEQLGALDRALPQFERLYLLSNDIFTLYRTATLQLQLEKHEEALNSIAMIVRDRKSAEEKIGFNLGDNQSQEIVLRAAALNLKGLVYVAQGSKSEALAAFQEALALEPEFRLAQENLKENS
ncbi:MAG: tetratricopeptide repeat protein [Nitritalea sp.]